MAMQKKLLLIFALILFLLIILLLRIAYINVKSGKKYAKQVLSQENYDSRTLVSRRGEIQDTNGRVIAYSEKKYNLVLDCSAINQDAKNFLEPTVKALNEVFDLDRDDNPAQDHRGKDKGQPVSGTERKYHTGTERCV